jgi:hypothetical protein
MTDERPKGQQQNRFYGDYIAVVESVSDPENLMRVQVRVYGVFTDKVPKADLPWAEYLLPIGARTNDGYFTPVDVGDYVWVRFPYDGDTRRPMIVGSVHHAPSKIPSFPHESFAGSEKLTHKTTGEEPAPAAAEYHKNCVYTQHGITIEVNADKSVSITQRATGTAIRVSPQGDITLHGEKNIFMSAIENLKVIVEGTAQFDVSGKADVTVRETCNLKAMDAVTVNSDASVSIVGAESVSIDGGTGDLEGVITGKSVCPLTGKPHSDPSTNVKASHG